MRHIRIGTRPSPLALKQAEEAIALLGRIDKRLQCNLVKISTDGDLDRITPISNMEGSDFFTRQIEESLLNREIDLAVHSAKDLPDCLPKGLVIAAITESVSPYDCLVSKGNLALDKLPLKAKVGTSSERRKSQLKTYRADFEIRDLRGNIGERITLLFNSDLDAIVIAEVGLIRLGLERYITQRIPFEILKPHPLQGALAMEIREDNQELRKLLEPLNKCLMPKAED